MSLPMTWPPCARGGDHEVAGHGVPQVQQVERDIRDARRVGGARAIRLRNRREDARVQCGERRQDRVFRARALDQLERLRQHGQAAGRRHEARFGVRALVAAEEEDAIALDWTADGESSLVAAGLRLVDPIFLIEVVVLVERLVLEVEQRRPGDLVGAAAGDQLEVAAAGAARRGVVEARLQLDFLQRIGGRSDVVTQRTLVAGQVRGIDAVEKQTGARRPRPVHRRRNVARAVDQDGREIGAHARFRREQMREASGGRGNDLQVGATQPSRRRRRHRVEERGISRDLHDLGQSADFQRDRDRTRHRRLDLNAARVRTA